MEFTGTVVRKSFAAGSKSEHSAVFLTTGACDYKLERVDGNPFHDPELEKLVGKRVEVTGQLLAGHTLRIGSFAILE
ncbi:MAG TPA: hypothetical protein VF614_15415 [Chthoniobacteraceae bacterium]|jgi:hypothetical protein